MNIIRIVFFGVLLSALAGALLAGLAWAALLLVPWLPAVSYGSLCGVAWAIMAAVTVVRFAANGPFVVEQGRYGSYVITRPWS